MLHAVVVPDGLQADTNGYATRHPSLLALVRDYGGILRGNI